MKTKFFVILIIFTLSGCSWIWRKAEALGEYMPVSSNVKPCKGNVYCGSGRNSAPQTSEPESQQQTYPDPYQETLMPQSQNMPMPNNSGYQQQPYSEPVRVTPNYSPQPIGYSQ